MDKLAADGFDPTYGARPLRRSVQRLIEDPLAEEVLLGRFSAGDIVLAELDGEGEDTVVIFRKKEIEDTLREIGEESTPAAIAAAPGTLAEPPTAPTEE